MMGGLNRIGRQPKPPKVCRVSRSPLISNEVWLEIINVIIHGPIAFPPRFDVLMDVTPRVPNVPPGAPIITSVHTDLPVVLFFLTNFTQSAITFPIEKPGLFVQYTMLWNFPATTDSYEWYARTPLYPPP